MDQQASRRHGPTTRRVTPSASRWRRHLGSARVRIVAWHVLLLAVVLGLAIVSMRFVLLLRLDERIGRELAEETAEVRTLANGDDPETGEPFGGNADRIFDVFLEAKNPARNEAYVTYVDGRPYLDRGNDALFRFHGDPRLTASWGRIDGVDEGVIVREPVGEIAYRAVALPGGGEAEGVFVAAWFRDVEVVEIDRIIALFALGSGVVLLLAAAIVWNVTGRVLRPAKTVAATARSITETDLTRRIDVHGADEISEIAETFNRMLDRLETAFRAQRDFVDDAGHELRTPITIIRGHLELLELGDAADREATVALVLDELGRMHRMVEDLLLLAKSQRPDFLALGEIELRELTRELFHKATALAPRDWRLETLGDGTLVGDRQRLTQAVVELAQNAVQHTSAGQRIALGSMIAGGQARLWVADSGTGVDPGRSGQIFERFTRLRRSGEGAGLGLAIVRAIAEAHGGDVALTRTPGGGATFTLVLPGARAAVEQGAESTQGNAR